MRASAALENLQLDRKTRNFTTTWRLVSHLFILQSQSHSHSQMQDKTDICHVVHKRVDF